MSSCADADWYVEALKRLIKKYGDVPPPWVYVPDSHPYSIGWRMGAGETLIMVFSEWWPRHAPSEAQRIAYFRKWPPPPRWMAWTVHALWGLPPSETDEEFDYQPYFKKLEALGFGGTSDYERDLEDERWV